MKDILMKKQYCINAGFIRQTLIVPVLLCFCGPMALKCVSMNNQQCMVRFQRLLI